MRKLESLKQRNESFKANNWKPLANKRRAENFTPDKETSSATELNKTNSTTTTTVEIREETVTESSSSSHNPLESIASTPAVNGVQEKNIKLKSKCTGEVNAPELTLKNVDSLGDCSDSSVGGEKTESNIQNENAPTSCTDGITVEESTSNNHSVGSSVSETNSEAIDSTGHASKSHSESGNDPPRSPFKSPVSVKSVSSNNSKRETNSKAKPSSPVNTEDSPRSTTSSGGRHNTGLSTGSGNVPRQRRRVTFRQLNNNNNNNYSNDGNNNNSSVGGGSMGSGGHSQQQMFTGASAAAAAEFNKKQQWVKNARAWDSPLWWVTLALLRLLLAAVQSGYIHPDEFHQSLQVRARDVLHIEGQKPWEFTTSTPIRSIVFSWFISLPYTAMRLAAPYASYYLNWTLLTPTALLVTPRIFITLFSFLADFCVYRIARMCYIRPWQCMEVFASSYVMLVYSTRTFSNTVELILMCVVLWRVSVSIVESSTVIRRETLIQDLYQSSDDIRDKVRLMRMRNALPPYNYVDSLLLSVVITYGTFVRPTFIIYTFIPVAYWLQRGVITKELDFKYFNRRCFSLLPGLVMTFLFCVIADSLYYESLTPKEVLQGNVTASSFTVTPINFFLYNKETKNLAKHGTHPHYLHVLVNLPLLHGVLAFIGLFYSSLYISSIFGTGSITKKPKLYSLASMLLLSFIVPVLVLSWFPHQEARFLLPTLPCLVLLHSDKVSLHNLFKLKFSKHFLFLMWHTWNIFCVLFFGFLHQGGVTNAMIHIHDYIQEQPDTFETPLHVYFTHMYTPPTFLLMRRVDVVASTEEGRKFKVSRSVFSHHLAGSTTVSQLNTILYSRLNFSSTFPALPDKSHKKVPSTRGGPTTEISTSLRRKSDAPRLEVLLCLPGSIASKLNGNNPNFLQFTLLHRLPLHVTLENLPDFTLRASDFSEHCNEVCAARNKLKQFSMEIYKVELDADAANWKEDQNTYYEPDPEDEEKCSIK
uniref:Mannosyltransferase n=1 Tax=Hirondellea gigas TaxID=1518452 RepID=A0A2P2I9C0_9CRUS